MTRRRKAVDDNHGLCPKAEKYTTPSRPGPHIFQHPTNLSPTWCILCDRAPAVLCDAHPGRHAWAADCVKALDADTKGKGGEP